MGRIDDRLAELGLELPRPFAPPPGVQFPFELVHVSGGILWTADNHRESLKAIDSFLSNECKM